MYTCTACIHGYRKWMCPTTYIFLKGGMMYSANVTIFIKSYEILSYYPAHLSIPVQYCNVLILDMYCTLICRTGRFRVHILVLTLECSCLILTY